MCLLQYELELYGPSQKSRQEEASGSVHPCEMGNSGKWGGTVAFHNWPTQVMRCSESTPPSRLPVATTSSCASGVLIFRNPLTLHHRSTSMKSLYTRCNTHGCRSSFPPTTKSSCLRPSLGQRNWSEVVASLVGNPATTTLILLFARIKTFKIILTRIWVPCFPP